MLDRRAAFGVACPHSCTAGSSHIVEGFESRRFVKRETERSLFSYMRSADTVARCPRGLTRRSRNAPRRGSRASRKARSSKRASRSTSAHDSDTTFATYACTRIAAARALDAQAFTLGNHIVFAPGYRAGTQQGRELLAHELAHVGVVELDGLDNGKLIDAKDAGVKSMYDVTGSDNFTKNFKSRRCSTRLCRKAGR